MLFDDATPSRSLWMCETRSWARRSFFIVKNVMKSRWQRVSFCALADTQCSLACAIVSSTSLARVPSERQKMRRYTHTFTLIRSIIANDTTLKLLLLVVSLIEIRECEPQVCVCVCIYLRTRLCAPLIDLVRRRESAHGLSSRTHLSSERCASLALTLGIPRAQFAAFVRTSTQKEPIMFLIIDDIFAPSPFVIRRARCPSARAQYDRLLRAPARSVTMR